MFATAALSSRYRLFARRKSSAAAGGHPEGWKPNWRTSVTPEEFIEARKATKRPGFLSPLAPEDIAGHKLLLSEDGKVGAAISPDGDVQNVFNNGGPRGAGNEALLESIKCGGDTLDCFDGHLPTYYKQFGFNEVGRMKFNREYAPPGWDFDKYGEPDVVFMARDEEGDEDAIRQRAYGDREQWSPPKPAESYYEGEQWDQAKEDSRRTARARANRGGQGLGVDQPSRGTDSGSGSGGWNASGLAKSVRSQEAHAKLRPIRGMVERQQPSSVSRQQAIDEAIGFVKRQWKGQKADVHLEDLSGITSDPKASFTDILDRATSTSHDYKLPWDSKAASMFEDRMWQRAGWPELWAKSYEKSGSGCAGSGRRTKTLGPDRYRLFVRYKAQVNRPKGLDFDIISFDADEMLSADDLKKLHAPNDTYSVVYDSRENKWHVPTYGQNKKDVIHEYFLDKLIPKGNDRDQHIVRGWYNPAQNSLRLYSIGDWANSDSGMDPLAKKNAVNRAMAKASKNVMMVNGSMPKVTMWEG